MATQTLRTVVDLGPKKLTFESSLNESQKQMVSTVLSGGMPVLERKSPVTQELVAGASGGSEEVLNRSHQALLSEIEFIFATSRKIMESPSPSMCFAMGVILLTRGFHDDALLHFQQTVDLDPSHIQAIKHYGIALVLKGDLENARHVFNHILEAGVDYADIHYHLGNTYLFQRQFDRARPCYEEALRINPRYSDAHLRLAACAVGMITGENNGLVEAAVQGYAEEARREAQLALDGNPRIMNGALLSATDSLRQGKYPVAFKHFMECRPAFSPKTGTELVYFYTLKLLYGDKGVSAQETEEYVRQLEQLVEANPTYVDLRLHFGMGNLMKSNFLVGRSLKEMNKALEVNPNFQKARSTADLLTDVYKKMLQAVKNVYSGKG